MDRKTIKRNIYACDGLDNSDVTTSSREIYIYNTKTNLMFCLDYGTIYVGRRIGYKGIKDDIKISGFLYKWWIHKRALHLSVVQELNKEEEKWDAIRDLFIGEDTDKAGGVSVVKEKTNG